MDNPALVLASASPRRVELLRQLGLPFEQVVSPADEPPPRGSDAAAYVLASARTKARAVVDLLARDAAEGTRARRRTLVIGADTVVCRDRDLLGKPADAEDAARMLASLSGREHTVCTGIVVAGPGPDDERAASEITAVRFGDLAPATIAAYVASGEPLDKAGGYAIQGLGARFVESVMGCYYNVVGLPLARLCRLLEAAGYDLDPSRDTE